MHYGIVVHGGVGSHSSWSDGCKKAAEKGFKIINDGGSAVDAAVEAVVCLENDGRYDAGVGSVLRLDGKTIECDAAIMTSEGEIGSVINVRNVKNPVLLARKVMQTPHVAIAGRGAENLAKRFGLYGELKPSESAKANYLKKLALLKSRAIKSNKKWNDAAVKNIWNFDVDYSEVLGCDTVGAVAVDKEGGFAVATSTGGASPMLLGRVGDTPLPGCGFYCGEDAAVAATGLGEEIIKHMLSFRLYEMLEQGADAELAARQVTAGFKEDVPVGLIAITRKDHAIFANKSMAAYKLLGS